MKLIIERATSSAPSRSIAHDLVYRPPFTFRTTRVDETISFVYDLFSLCVFPGRAAGNELGRSTENDGRGRRFRTGPTRRKRRPNSTSGTRTDLNDRSVESTRHRIEIKVYTLDKQRKLF